MITSSSPAITSVFHFLLSLFILLHVNPSVSDPRATQAALICTNRTAPVPQRPVFVSNFIAALDAISPQVSNKQYGAAINGTDSNTTVYAFGECMKDLDRTDCDLCIAQCKTQILKCFPFQLAIRGGKLYYDGCYLRYDDYNFFNETLSDQDRVICGNDTGGFGVNRTVFRENMGVLVRNLSLEAVKKDGFSVGVVDKGNVSVYGLAQCWEFVNGGGCGNCLANAVSRISSCGSMEEGRVLNAGCYLRYSTKRFYFNNTATPAIVRSGGNRRFTIIIAVISSCLAFALITSSTLFIARKKVLKKKREKKQLGSLLTTLNRSSLNFSYETLEKATNFFSEANKLGQGGSGSVFKGILPDGKPVAIKRLFFNTTQWVDHFFNEVNLISGIHHPNLVKLLGCSITGPESLLVYEYVPNHCLYDHIYGKKYCEPLRWEVRCSVILGTAEGLAYLHEESTLRIIHRDIKLTNVLLDNNFAPKIADFGLVRLFPEDRSHISTAVAGTLGYMAPEYIVRGKLTEKADVYSFGVLLIEVISGRRVNSFSKSSVSLLQMVWNMYEAGHPCEVIDPILHANYEPEEASRLVQISLLCVQASPELRPSMSTVVKMLTGNHEIPQPTQPPFLSTSSAQNSKVITSSSNYSMPESHTQSSGATATENFTEPR